MEKMENLNFCQKRQRKIFRIKFMYRKKEDLLNITKILCASAIRCYLLWD